MEAPLSLDGIEAWERVEVDVLKRRTSYVLMHPTFAYDRREDARALMIMIQGPVVSP